MHTILSGPIHSGKSTRLMREVERFVADGKKVSGFVCLPLTVNRSPVVAEKEYDIVFITMNKIHEPRRFIRSEPFGNSFVWRRFYFDQTIFDDVEKMDFGKPDIFVIDEVGPLEIEDHQGFWKILLGLYKKHTNTVTVVRSELTRKFRCVFAEINFAADQSSSSLSRSNANYGEGRSNCS